ncbi:MAG: EamA family transporter [Pyrinomonadaceae bacterium]|nr:EamA family transporter [Pyrinomonadaceae bacterium]
MKIIVWLLLCLIWGTTWFAIKVGLRDLPPISFAGVRFISAGLILLAIISFQKISLPKTKRDWTLLAVTGFLQFSFNYSMVFWSEQYISSGLAAVLQATIPAFGLVMARVHLPQEKITWRKIIALLLGIVGVATIFIEQLHVNNWLAFAGCVAVVAGAFAAAEASILTKSFGASLHPASLLFGQMMCGLLPLLLVGFFKEGSPLNFHWTSNSVFAVLYLAIVGTIAAFWLYYWLLQRVESTKAMTIALVTPLVAVFVGAMALDEKLVPQTYFGGALILSSVGLITFRRQPKTSVKNIGRQIDIGSPRGATETQL